jgi:hypothetical protein
LPALYTNGGILTDPNYLTYLSNPSDPDLYNASEQLVGEHVLGDRLRGTAARAVDSPNPQRLLLFRDRR